MNMFSLAICSTPFSQGLRRLRLSLRHEADGASLCGICTAISELMDSGRADVQYDDLQGHKLDRKMLELVRRYLMSDGPHRK